MPKLMIDGVVIADLGEPSAKNLLALAAAGVGHQVRPVIAYGNGWAAEGVSECRAHLELRFLDRRGGARNAG